MMGLVELWLPWEEGHTATEASIEANPLDINKPFCDACRRHNIQRISIGGQSFHASKLKRLERDHSPADLIRAILLAQEYFSSVSVDLIFGAPEEQLQGWIMDVQQAIEMGVDHVSTYGLTYEKGAKFWSLREKGLLSSVDDSVELDMYQSAIDVLEAAGFVHYEVSNFAKPGHPCRHNQAYWNGDRWWAFGPSAARFVGMTRSVNHRGTLEYLRRIESSRCPISEVESLTEDQLSREKFVFGMRQRQGVNWEQLKSVGPPNTTLAIEQKMLEHVAQGWMEWEGEHIRLSRRGLVISDSLWSDYL